MEDRQVRVTLGDAWPRGESFDVVAMRPGVANGYTFTEDVLRRSVELRQWEGVTMFVDHAGFWSGRGVGDVAGVLRETRFDGGVCGVMACIGPKGEVVASLARGMLADQAVGVAVPDVGLSADLMLRLDGEAGVVDIVRVFSVDVVVSPAAGGAFVRALNSVIRGGVGMSERQVPADAGEFPVVGPPAVDVEGLARLQCAHALDAALAASALPDAVAQVVRGRFTGRLFTADELSAEVALQRGMLAGLMESGVVRGLGAGAAAGGPVVSQMSDGVDRLRIAFGRLLGLPVGDAAADVPRLYGVRELYHLLTGDYEGDGLFHPERVTFANATKTTMASIVTDGLNKLLIAAFNRREMWWKSIVSMRDLSSWQDMKLIRPYGFAALDTVAEGAPYTEKAWDDGKETASIVKKGNYIGLTLEMLMSDDVGAVRNIPAQLGSAAYNALSDAVSEIFTGTSGTGPLMADGYRLFEVAHHANLLTTALSETQFGVVATAMMKQTEPGSSRQLGLKPAYLLVPADLFVTAMVIRNTKLKTGSANNDVNPWFERFEVVQVPQWTDANDWACVASPADCDGIVVGFPFGRREPELFVADDGVVGSMFTNDEMRIKARYVFAVGVADYRPLHKSNVA